MPSKNRHVTPPTLEELVCPTCQAGPFKDRRGLAAHAGNHIEAECEICGRRTTEHGLRRHRASHTAEPKPPKPGKPEPPPEVQMALRLVGRLATDGGRERILELLERTQHFPDGGFLVIGDDWGPHITSRLNVGQVVASGRQACVVLPLGLAVQAVHLEAHREAMAELAAAR